MLQYLTFFFLFTYPPTTQIYTLSLHDALPISDLTDDRARLVEAPRVARAREREADALHRLLEELAVLGLPDRGELGADQLDAEALERAVLGERDREVQARLAAERREQRLRPLALDDLGDELGRERLHVGPLGELRVGHDRRGVRVHEDDLEPLLAKRLHRLGARVVELARLADDDRPRADDQDLPEVRPLGHPGPPAAPAILRPAHRRSTSRARPLHGDRGHRPDAPGRSRRPRRSPRASRPGRSCAARRARGSRGLRGTCRSSS